MDKLYKIGTKIIYTGKLIGYKPPPLVVTTFYINQNITGSNDAVADSFVINEKVTKKQ